ncbi:MAG: glutamyl-tRNA reductase [Ktedonobacteraceae bacterium]|nr:glutamyl-tRNA reductase [Ktedonobacteraceae bacterium]
MRIVVVGVDHTTAPIELRERLACSSRQGPQLLQAVCKVVQECVILSTCNRVEVYAVPAELDDVQEVRAGLLQVLSEERRVPFNEIDAHCYFLADQEAIEHLFGVACGLYSLVPGEPQIQGQVVESLEIAQSGGYCGPILSALFRAAVVTGKRARSETGISRNAASVSHVAVQLARHLFPDFTQASVLLVGSGKMSELAARNLRAHGAGRLVIVNRTQGPAAELARELGAEHRPFSELADALGEADVVISSTTAPHAIITPALMRSVSERRAQHAQRLLLLIDIALPRDVDPAVAAFPGVHLYNLDDLQAEVERGIGLRLQEVEHVQAIIAQESGAFMRWLASLSVVGTISDLRRHMDDLRQQELARAMRQFSSTLSERELAAVQELSTRLVNKLLHTPMLRLKEAAADGRGHIYAEALRYLFGLEEEHAAYYDRDAGKQARNEADISGDRAAERTVARS